jgi:hypothetical protein
MNVVSLVEYGYLKNDEDNGFVIADIPFRFLPQSLLLPLPRSVSVLKQHVKMRKM